MMFRILFSCVLSVAVFTDAIAGGVDASNKKSNWGATGVSLDSNLCKGRDLGTATIGAKRDTCIGVENDACLANGSNRDYGVMMMVARTINDGGARFCATTVVSQRAGVSGSKCNAVTVYANPKEGENCVWLCQNGYYGDKCENKGDTPSKADSNPIKRDNFNSLNINNGGANIESTIAMFEMDRSVRCTKLNKIACTIEHDIILGISEWTSSGHGAFVRPFIVRAHFKPSVKHPSWPEISQAGTKVLVCKNGYKPNAGKTDCEPMNRSATVETTEEKLTQMCYGWDKANFKSSEHKMELVGDCYQFRCSQPGYAFNEGEYSTCIECSANLRGGVSPRDGSCVKCELGKVFDSSAASSGYCVDATRLSKTDMQYGPGKKKKDFDGTDKIKNQCWTKTDPDDYKACVLGTTSSTGGKIKSAKEMSSTFRKDVSQVLQQVQAQQHEVVQMKM